MLTDQLDRQGVTLAPIGAQDLTEVGEFLHRHLDARKSALAWARAIVPTWPVASPNHGFLLRDGDRVVGVQVAIYSEREVDGEPTAFCNLAAWCVLEDYRSQSVRLLRAVLRQPGYHVTDLSPSGNVVAVNRKLGFCTLDTTTALVVASPVVGSRGARVVDDPAGVERLLSGWELTTYLDHRDAEAAIHVVLVRGDEHCYVIARRDRRKGVRLFASLLHVSNPGLLRGHLPVLARHLLLHHGTPFTIFEVRRFGSPPRGARVLHSSRPKMYRSARGTALAPAAVDDLYSELTLVSW